MIDASVDQDFAALERQDSFRDESSVANVGVIGGIVSDKVYHGRIGNLSARSAHRSTETVIGVPPPSDTPPSDPLGHLRTARLGFAAAVVLVLYWLWLREKRKR